MMQMPMGQYRPGNTFFHRAGNARGKAAGELCLVHCGDRVQRADWLYRRWRQRR